MGHFPHKLIKNLSLFLQDYPFGDSKDWPKCHKLVKKYILDHAAKVQNFVANDFSSRINSGLPFSLTLDEWTSLKNRKYVNINAHHQHSYFDCLWLGRA